MIIIENKNSVICDESNYHQAQTLYLLNCNQNTHNDVILTVFIRKKKSKSEYYRTICFVHGLNKHSHTAHTHTHTLQSNESNTILVLGG